MSDWSPATYLRFEDERTRGARDLLAQVPLADARKVVDVGCGPGNSTELLASRFPDAEVTGIDSSPAMLAEARQRLPDARFEAADAEVWTPAADVDLVFANATYQWVPGHLEQLPKVLAALRPGAVLAVQMPDNVGEPSHQLMQAVGESGAWAARLAHARRVPLPPAQVYYDTLVPLAERLDVWRTTYHHVMADAAAIVSFVSSTGLRPYLDALDAGERPRFVDQYTARIDAAYPPQADGNRLFAFPRLFIVAQR
ncbi:MAG TPA: trans-aconitate 2-methyltransferase [Caulobacteraceae bacterium]|jgi:trans-aconitate 2-methyltransferase